MSTATRPLSTPAGARAVAHGTRDWLWIGGGAIVAFAIPFVWSSTLHVQRDVFYGLYGASLALFLWAYLRDTGIPVRPLLRRNWRWGVAFGIAGAGVMAVIAYRSSQGSAHPGGLGFALAILWRGVFYGALDGILLSVFPILAVFHAFRDRALLERLRGKLAVGALALAVSVAFTAVYHLGYPDFRSSKLAKPVAGDLVWSAPTLLTLNPVGAPIAHIGLHVTAVVHDYQTDLFLPPHAG
jgi:hypothetical protein